MKTLQLPKGKKYISHLITILERLQGRPQNLEKNYLLSG